MSKLSAYFFLTVGLGGVIFFLTYSGTAIQSKELWLVFCFFMIIIGGFLLAKQKLESIRRSLNEPRHTAETKSQSTVGDKSE